MADIEFKKCPACGSDEVRRLPSDWQAQVIAASGVIRTVGCGWPWHYEGINEPPGEAVELREGIPA